MEQYNKNNYLNSFRKNQHKYRESNNYYKKNYSSNFYKYDDDYFPEKHKINKNIPKTSFIKINPTKKNPRITEFNKTEKNFEKEEKNYIINDSSKNEISISNRNDQKIISNSKTNLLNDIKNSINSYIIRQNLIKNNNNLNRNQSYINELYNDNNNSYNYNNSKFSQQSQVIPYYNSVNYNNNNNNNYYYLYSLNPKQISNSINNYYINNNIIIYNNLNSNSNANSIITHNSPNNQLYNIYPNSNIINNNINKNSIFNQYLSKNYSNLNNFLFSKNEEASNLNSKKNSINDPKKENTCILEINLKFSNNKIYNFKLNRFDDLFETVHIFCQINRLNTNLYIPIIINIMKALNSIYGIYNLKLNEKELNELQFLKYFYFNSKEDSL